MLKLYMPIYGNTILGSGPETIKLENPGEIDGININLGRAADDIQRNDIYSYNCDMDIADGEQIIAFGTPFNSNVYPSFPASSSQMLIASLSADDTLEGTGGRTGLIIGLNTAYEEIEEEFNFNGQTSVTTTLSYFRVNEVVVLTAGSLLTNQGIITVTDTSDSHVSGVPQLRVYSVIPPFTGFSMTGIFTVPQGKMLIHVAIEMNTTIRGDLNNITVKLKADNDIVIEQSDVFYVHDNTYVNLKNTRTRIAKQSVWITAQTSVNNVELHVKMTTILAKERRRSVNFVL